MEDLDLLSRFLPSTRSGAVLITTRCQALGTVARGIDLLPMEQEEGMLFLLRRAKVLELEAERQQMRQLTRQMPHQYGASAELVRVLGGFPLALDQAGAYIEEAHCTLSAYLDLFCTQRSALLTLRGGGSRMHPESVSTTFTLSIIATAQQHPAVQDLLHVCALLQPDAIPEELFRQGAEHMGTTLSAICGNPLTWNQVIATACAYSLLSRRPEEQTLSLHRLVQAVLEEMMTEAERKQWIGRAMSALDAVFPTIWTMTEYAAWKLGERLLPHALLCLHQVEEASDSLTLASLAYKVALYLRERGRYAEAEPLYLRAVRIEEQVRGPDHAHIATLLNNLALLYWNQGRYAEAEPLYLRALHLKEQHLGSEHPEVARPLHNLAVLYREQGRYAEAEPLYLRALRLKEQQLGPEHPELAQTLNGLANLFLEQSKYSEAEPLYLRALSIRESHLGQYHPDTAETLDDLALLRKIQGNLNEAISLAESALSIRLQALGEAHPKTVATHALYTQLVQEQQAVEAEPTLEQLRALLKARGWSVHLKKRHSKLYMYATRKVDQHTQSRYLAPLSNLAACLATAATLPNVRER